MEQKYTCNKFIKVRFVSEDTYLMTNNYNGDTFEINETTKIIWDKIEDNHSPLEIEKYLKGIAKNPNEINIVDIMNTINYFVEYNLIYPL